MSVRPMTKRPGDGSDPLSLGDDSGYSLSNHPSADSKLKLPRIERGQDDFSTVVKNRLQSYTRTGQACDRCKVRKIRCDALPEGCSHCINLSLECYVTDRVTGRTERRGYMQELEREKNGMVSHIRDLERLLRENGIEVKPFKEVSTEDSYDPLPSGGSSRSSLSDFVQVGSLWVKNYPEKANYTPSFPRSQLEVDDTRPQPNAPLSTVRGTKLSILGTTIDTTSFEAPDVDEPPDGTPIDTPIYNKSVQAFLQSSMRVQPPMQVPMPSREDAFNYATWYFSTVAAFLPLLHQPSFMSLLTRIYDDPQFKPTAPEIVMVHMVFASILFNIGLRNEHRKQLNDLSNRHYHYALSLMYELQISKELAAVQALALIASHTRSFPKPGAGSIVAHLALQRAIDLNLHRAWKSPDEGTNLTNELRKRTFWTILMVVVAITGRRGLPIPISVEEFDVGLPEPIADELLTEDGVDTSRTLPCPYEAGIAGIKITTIFMEIYSNMYSVRRDPNNYTNIVKALEKQLHQWEEELPAALRKVSGEDMNLAALYMRGFYLEARLSLRHPSVAMTKDKKMLADNTRVCEEIGREFLQITKQIDKMRSLDTTWYSMSVYATCIFCMLVAHWERRFQTTPEKVQQLRTDMEDWMGVLRSISYLLGSGPGIASEIYKIMNRTINWIEHDMKRTDKVKRPAAESPVPIMVKTEYPPVQRSPPKSNVSHHRPRPQQQAPMPQVPPVQQLQLQPPQPPQQQPQLHPSQHHHPHMQAATQTQPSPPMHNQQHQHQHQHQQGPLPPQMQQQQSHVDRVSPEAGGVHGSASPENANASTYYANGDPSQTNYVTMGYNTTAGQQQIVPATSTYQPQAQMYYATTAQVPNGTVQDTAGQVISFGSHPSAITSADFLWQARGTTWQDWTQAIADPDERYNANALIDIGGNAPQSRLNVDNSMLQNDPTSMPQSHPEMTATHMQPWPMAIFGHGGATGS
ncbi:hypothetical protein VHEMI09842 [[Torrubiella] hemipterigena]|uniref:Zn(2)-C6 fungal-type domain-containing protein n=1 Tax=[Torrubiella] hemipterigena TaxID=1531966 RepID=A0A0A1TS92_9HYPO|nr:hypothetical protein VHEMI09842 [[Torrubiella] hemipterigena]